MNKGLIYVKLMIAVAALTISSSDFGAQLSSSLPSEYGSRDEHYSKGHN